MAFSIRSRSFPLLIHESGGRCVTSHGRDPVIDSGARYAAGKRLAEKKAHVICPLTFVPVPLYPCSTLVPL